MSSNLKVLNKYGKKKYWMTPCCHRRFYEEDFLKSGDREVNYYDYVYCCGYKYERRELSQFTEMTKENCNENRVFWLLVIIGVLNCIIYNINHDMMFLYLDFGFCALALIYKVIWLLIDIKHC